MSRRAIATAIALLGVSGLLEPGLASAGLRAQSVPQGVEAVGTSTFAVVPTTLTTPLPGPLVLSYAAVLSPPAKYFDAVNTGSIDLVGASYSVTVAGGGIADPSITLASCSGTWNEVSGACSGTVSTIGTWSNDSNAPVASSVVPMTPGERRRLKASISASGLLTLVTTATIDISVSSGPLRQIRAAQTTTS